VLGGSVHTIKKTRGAVVVTGKEIRIEVNSDKNTYMVMSRG
jgi:hypothetical protein